MSQDMQIFNNDDFGSIRVIEIDGEPWFVAKDVCDCLELTNLTMALQKLDDDERAKFNLGRQGMTNIVNEYGIFNLTLSSRKKEARKFKRWVIHDVLPSIRKRGIYATLETTEKIINDPDFGIRLLQSLKEERQKNQNPTGSLEEQKPKVLFADTVVAIKILQQKHSNSHQKRFSCDGYSFLLNKRLSLIND